MDPMGAGRKLLNWLLIIVLVQTACFANVSQHKRQLDNLKNKEKQIRQELQKTEREERSVLATLGQLEQQIEQSRSQIEVLNRDYKAKGEEVARTQAKLASTKKELDKAKKALSARQEALNQRLRAIYMAGSGGYLELLFTSNSFGDFLVRLDLLKRILKQDETLFNEIKAQQEVIEVQLAALRKQEQELLAQQNKLAALERDRRREQAKLVSSRQSYESYRRKLQANIREFEKALDELERESRRLESLIRSQQSPGTPQASGSFIWPVHGRISSEFGRRVHPVTGQVRNHNGIDIALPAGNPVVAAQSGKVIHSGWINGYGYTVIIDHGGGISTLYAHNSALLVQAGQQVSRGQTIARVGSTGLSTGPHVHFEVRKNGVPVNPRNYLP